MAYFPFMIDVADRICLIAGGGRVAYRKTINMLEFGAKVKIVAPDICTEIDELTNKAEYENRISLARRRVEEADTEDAFVVIMATDDEKLNSHMASVCKDRNILVNVVDVKEDCGFYFPAIIKDRDVVVAVSTGGQSPTLAARIKQDIKKSIPENCGFVAQELGRRRQEILEAFDQEQDRKKAFRKLMEELLTEDVSE
jgi:siroheme synthase-like protein